MRVITHHCCYLRGFVAFDGAAKVSEKRLMGFLVPMAALLFWASPPAFPATALPATTTATIDKIVTDVLKRTGVPSASVAVVQDGKIVYARAYGNARLDPETAASPEMRYSIGSISKQFTAAAILLLQEDGKLSLDDKVAKYFPVLTDASDVTIRQLLSHTAGYQDYWPQDYPFPEMKLPTTPTHVMETWAKKPLDFSPGTQWQYSNTNYVIAGLIVQKVSGQTPFEFLQQRVFPRIGITDAYNSDLHALPAEDAVGYSRNALGPLRPVQKGGAFWVFATGELAMTASDLAKWDIAMIDQTVLQPASWRAMQTNVLLNNGLGSGYGLGVFIGRPGGHRMIAHSGEVIGFTADNNVFPDERAAVVVLINQDAANASSLIGWRITQALFEVDDPATAQALAQVKSIFTGLQHGKIDRALFTANANGYFDKTALADYANSLVALGAPTAISQTSKGLRGGMMIRMYEVTFPKIKLEIITDIMPDGKLEQYIVSPAG